MKSEQRARKAIFRRIEALAPEANAEDLQKLAEAHAKTRFGAQGHTVYDYRAFVAKGGDPPGFR